MCSSMDEPNHSCHHHQIVDSVVMKKWIGGDRSEHLQRETMVMVMENDHHFFVMMILFGGSCSV